VWLFRNHTGSVNFKRLFQDRTDHSDGPTIRLCVRNHCLAIFPVLTADINLALTKLETNWWLELERGYTSRIAERKSLFEGHGKLVLDYLPGSELACKELMEMALQFYCARYPHYFSISSDKKVFHNGILKTDTKIKSMHPLHVLLNNVPEDFAIMLRNPENGYYYFRAGLICSSLGWNVGTKLGLQLREIHAPIPDYKEKMEFSMDRYAALCSPIVRPYHPSTLSSTLL